MPDTSRAQSAGSGYLFLHHQKYNSYPMDIVTTSRITFLLQFSCICGSSFSHPRQSTMQRYESEDFCPETLAHPLHFHFSGKAAKTRFLKSAMSERLASWDAERLEARGIPSESMVNLYRRWGECGDIGVIVTGCVMVHPAHLVSTGNPVVPIGSGFSGERFERYQDVAQQAKRAGSLVLAQLSHPGRQVAAEIQPNPVSASAVPMKGPKFGMTFAEPHAASHEEICELVDAFAHAAEFLEKAGYDGVQLHAAHGYLLAQFLSTSTNKRLDQYGGSLENRSRLIIDIARAIRSRTRSDFIVGIKLNSVEFQEGVVAEELGEAKRLCNMLEMQRFDFIEVSGGTWEAPAFTHKRESTRIREAFFIEFADVIAPVLSKTKLYITGGFKTGGAMARAIANSSCDGVGIARPLCQEPRLCSNLIAGVVKGCIRTLLDDDDHLLSHVAAGTHMRQIGKDEEPINLSSKSHLDGFMEDLSAWMGRSGDVGYFDVVSAPVAPYGSASLLLS